jgi:hypothetical protein
MLAKISRPWRGRRATVAGLILQLLSVMGFSAPASAETLYLRCSRYWEGKELPLYVAVDLDRKLAKLSAYPADDRRWSPAEITNTTIRWSFSAGKWEETYVLNRYSGTLNYYHKHPDTGSQLIVHTCQRTEPPRKQF